jgi:hypothetical protein
MTQTTPNNAETLRQIAIKATHSDPYKMHGDIANPDEVIICKDDYEHDARRQELFRNQLAAASAG